MNSIYDDAVHYTRMNDGGTFLVAFDGDTVKALYPMSKSARAYVLSVDDELGEVIPYNDFNFSSFTRFVVEVRQIIKQWNGRSTNYGTLKAIGTWVYEDKVYLDVVTVYNKDEFSLEIILEMARDNAQRFIWDNELQVALEVPIAVG